MPLCSVYVDLISQEFESRITLGVTPIFFFQMIAKDICRQENVEDSFTSE